MENLRAIVLANGELVAGPLTLPDHALIIAADAGLGLASALGLTVEVVVGDMDSVLPADLEAAERSGARIERHSADKDATDLELALDAAVAAGAGEITIVGGSGGRLDHLLANAMILTAHRFAGVSLRWLTGAETVAPCDPRRPVHIAGASGEVVSLIPAGGSVGGVTTSGLRWELDRDDLIHGSTKGISNEMTASEATVAVERGTLLVVHERAR